MICKLISVVMSAAILVACFAGVASAASGDNSGTFADFPIVCLESSGDIFVSPAFDGLLECSSSSSFVSVLVVFPSSLSDNGTVVIKSSAISYASFTPGSAYYRCYTSSGDEILFDDSGNSLDDHVYLGRPFTVYPGTAFLRVWVTGASSGDRIHFKVSNMSYYNFSYDSSGGGSGDGFGGLSAAALSVAEQLLASDYSVLFWDAPLDDNSLSALFIDGDTGLTFRQYIDKITIGNMTYQTNMRHDVLSIQDTLSSLETKITQVSDAVGELESPDMSGAVSDINSNTNSAVAGLSSQLSSVQQSINSTIDTGAQTVSDTITDAAGSVVSGILDGVTGLFVPDEDALTGQIDDMQSWVDESFSVLEAPTRTMTWVRDLFTSVQPEAATLTFPAIAVPVGESTYNLTSAAEFDFSTIQGIDTLLPIIRTVTTGGIAWQFVLYIKRKVHEIATGDSSGGA